MTQSKVPLIYVGDHRSSITIFRGNVGYGFQQFLINVNVFDNLQI